ncbi:3-hydroxyacyl-CoA dehydrogenase/enoyl-CoA hydratase/3-hydroxybutyryl-CoA epimerase OS=Streptomyces violarus OX=67380 GN=FHS41_001037 PE=3 SV=1 [Streptomyces violarus]
MLKDVSLEAAVKGKGYSEELCAKAVAKGRTTQEKADALLARITPTAEVQDLAGCDAVIEAVFEDTSLKHKVFQEIQHVVAPDALLCSNTSTLPITALAEGVERQADFIGLHFFSPVHKLRSSRSSRASARGRWPWHAPSTWSGRSTRHRSSATTRGASSTSRVIGHFIYEGVAMVGEGVEPASVEQAAAQAGYPAKVLSLMDELTLTLPRKIRAETKRAVEEAGGTWTPHPAEAVIDRMVDEFGRTGRSGGAGFYDYGEDGKRTGLWPGLREHFTEPGYRIPFEDMRERMLFSEALDTVRLLEEGVLTSVADANIGSILGIGFPGWTGGVLQYINGYEGGLPGFVARARELAERYGDRFTPPALLVEKAEKGERFSDSA